MHSFVCKDGKNVIFYNGDYSGMEVYNKETKETISFPIDRDDFLSFARMAVGGELISLIENHFC